MAGLDHPQHGAFRCWRLECWVCVLGIDPAGARGFPHVVRYEIEVDAVWRTRKVEVELEDGGRRRVKLATDGEGNWSRDGQPLEQVAGCIDVDLEWSPSTNTLRIRRLGLAVVATSGELT